MRMVIPRHQVPITAPIPINNRDSGIAHPKKEYANERNARTILNLSMIFFQHCIQK